MPVPDMDARLRPGAELPAGASGSPPAGGVRGRRRRGRRAGTAVPAGWAAAAAMATRSAWENRRCLPRNVQGTARAVACRRSHDSGTASRRAASAGVYSGSTGSGCAVGAPCRRRRGPSSAPESRRPGRPRGSSAIVSTVASAGEPTRPCSSERPRRVAGAAVTGRGSVPGRASTGPVWAVDSPPRRPCSRTPIVSAAVVAVAVVARELPG